ncbi:MAG: preprotein translocase subunit YajC [Nitriliruptorales bacterium]|nr:preprotein translocase subunit YajC [Nitriliruptorales bacterium]
MELLILLGFFVLMYFIMIRPQQKKQKEHQEMLSQLSVDDDVITVGGLHGTVVSLHEDAVDLKVTDDVVLRFQRSSIGNVLGEDDEETEAEHESTTDA